MKQVYIFLFLLLSAVGVADAASLDAISRLRLRGNPDAGLVSRSSEQTPAYYPVIMQLSDVDKGIDELEADGVIILRRRGDMCLTYVPADKIDIVVAHRFISRMSLGRQSSVSLDEARKWQGADRILSGEGLPRPYDGDGVVVGICDVGFDPSHPAFRDPATGRSRIGRIVVYREDEGERIEIDPDSDGGFGGWITDDPDNTHATHVAGILAGGKCGNDYYGIASGAEIVATMSQLSDVGLLAGAEDIVEYARECGRPAVINLSVSSYVGPHDGTSLFSRYMDLIGRDAIVCLAAGNNGCRPNTIVSGYTESAPSIAFRLYNYKWTNFETEGITDVWNSDASPLSFRLGIYDDNINEIIGWTDPVSVTDSGIWGLSAGNFEPLEGDVVDPRFSEFFSGRFAACGEVDPDNGRYNLVLNYNMVSEEVSARGPWARYVITVELTGSRDATTYVYADGVLTKLCDHGAAKVNADASISDIACGHNVVSVGMYTSRKEVPLLDGTLYTEPYDAGVVNEYSSYGTLVDGRVTPMTVAPGFELVSSASRPYVEGNPQDASQLVAFDDGAYWMKLGGTSMATPYVAGFIATWLQAIPSLGIDDVKRLLELTNVMPEDSDPRNGMGFFRPYEALVEAMRQSSVVSLPGDVVKASAFCSDRQLNVLNPAGAPLTVDLYNAEGRQVESYYVTAEAATLPLTSVSAGVYIVRLTSDRDVSVSKIIVR